MKNKKKCNYYSQRAIKVEIISRYPLMCSSAGPFFGGWNTLWALNESIGRERIYFKKKNRNRIGMCRRIFF